MRREQHVQRSPRRTSGTSTAARAGSRSGPGYATIARKFRPPGPAETLAQWTRLAATA
ncbi:MAG: hypothetical protein IPQ21_09010 [Betaproteobacteria bacterium]|nr:hypothetical protein [Betaproteobacteria bacterium]